MNSTITKAKLKFKRFSKKARGILSRKFNISLSLRRKKEPDNPVVSVNVKGEIPREVVAFFAIFGALTFVWGMIKLIRKII
ncbi:MAG: hypothetical protein IJA60_02410 [Clostridia bacterium]|nr:hypothetical protein [Clostridia bacterium]